MTTKLKINGLDHQGNGISKIDNKVIFIPNTLPDELVEVEITKDKKNYLEGKLVNIIESSPKRIESKCLYYQECGGCNYLHVDIKEEEKIKLDIVKDILKRYANLEVDPIFISSKEYYYRNKIEFKIKDNSWGYYNSSSHNFIKIDHCLLAKDAINELIKDKELFNIQDGEIIIRCNYNNELLIKISTNDKCDININELIKKHKIVGIIVNDKLIYGEDSFIERIGGYLFKVNINSFFQINLDILNEVFNILKKSNYATVVDLYCGVGTLGMAVKKDKLYGIEIIPEAVKDAIKNAKINNQDNYYMLGDSSKIKEIKDDIDTIIIDPPRSGLNKVTLDNVLNIKPSNIVYMSCNPLTLARDLNIIKNNYEVNDFYVLNMFPRTKHCESIVILERK